MWIIDRTLVRSRGPMFGPPYRRSGSQRYAICTPAVER